MNTSPRAAPSDNRPDVSSLLDETSPAPALPDEPQADSLIIA